MITSVQSDTGFGLSGKGTIITTLDSGITYTHSDFQNENHTTRILYLWDQAAGGTPLIGFKNGAEYNSSGLNAALRSEYPFQVIPEIDLLVHGTAIAGITAGNGRADSGKKGVALEAVLTIVKLGEKGRESFARTTELMRGLKYVKKS